MSDEIPQENGGEQSNRVLWVGGILSWIISFLTFKSTGNGAAAGYLVVATVAYSFIPWLVSFSNGSEAPFLFNAWFRAGVAIACLMFIVSRYRSEVFSVSKLALIGKWVFVWPNNRLLILATIGTAEYALFAWSVKFIDIAVAAILFRVWPIFAIFLAYHLFKKDGRYRKITLFTWALVLMSAGGFAFALTSQFTHINVEATSLDLIVGLFLVLLAAIGAAFSTYGLKWGADLSNDSPSLSSDDKPLDLFGAVMALFISSLASAIASVILGTVSKESMPFAAPVVAVIGMAFTIPMIAVIGGVLTYGLASIAWRNANLKTDNLGVNAIIYATPIFSLIWLFGAGYADVSRPTHLFIGIILLIVANLLINLTLEIRSGDIRWGFRALLLALSTAGVLVYFRESIFDRWYIDWHWMNSGYFESVALSATVFTLILAFRVARLVSRARDEETRSFDIFRKLEFLSRQQVIDGHIRKCILDMDKARNDAELQQAYAEAREYIEIANFQNQKVVDIELQMVLNQAESSLDALARSKQKEIALGEIFALVIFAGITVALALFTYPSVESGWNRFLVDVFAMLISSVVIFLLANARDLNQDRDEAKLETKLRYLARFRYLVRFRDSKSNRTGTGLSIIVGILIVLGYAVLLMHQWLDPGWLAWLS